CENKDTPQYWEIQGVEFGQRNLIVGLNATGKTRLLDVITRLAGFILGKYDIIYHSEYIHLKTQFYDTSDDSIFSYELEKTDTLGGVSEKLEKNGEATFERSYKLKTEKKKFPNSDIVGWAKKYKYYSFNFKNQTTIYDHRVSKYRDSNILVRLLSTLLTNDKTEKVLLEDFDYVGFPTDYVTITISPIVLSKCVLLKEKGLERLTDHYRMSQGMFRALTLIVIIEDLLLSNSECTLVIDDIGEGLDFDRSSKLIKLIFSKLKDSNIQFIATTNNRFLINAVDIRDLNILEREGHVVKSYNYSNSKEQFDEFEFTGLGSFDLFRYQMYKTQEAQVE
ncbi:AAA family ATPase, partial [Candidatus Magnetobacterium casense]